MQAFCVDHSEVELVDAGGSTKREIQSARSVFTEHQVLPVGKGESLFVCALYRGLYSRPERSLGVVDDCAQRQLINEFVR